MIAAHPKIERVESQWQHADGDYKRRLLVYLKVPLTAAVADEVMAHILDNLALAVDATSVNDVILVGPFNA